MCAVKSEQRVDVIRYILDAGARVGASALSVSSSLPLTLPDTRSASLSILFYPSRRLW